MNTQLTLIASFVGLTLVAGCTKEIDIPRLAGPSTLAYSIVLTASPDTIFQDGVSSTTITIDARDGAGQALNGRPLRAEILVGGVVQDYGVLSTKAPLTGSTLRYTAPPASPLSAGQVPQTITVAVTPTDSGDFRSELSRGVDIRLVPQGVIMPSNPGLVPAFTFTPAAPQVFTTVSFNAATTTNSGTACNSACTYAWNFGDGTTGSGLTTTHQFRTVGATQVSLTVTDSRGAQASTVQTVTVAPGTLPAVSFSISPSPVGANQDVFFSAEASTVIAPRRIVSYDWNFGDGSSGTGVTTTHRYLALGTYSVTLKVTDDANVTNQATQALAVAEGLPTVTATVSGLKVGGTTQLNITATPATGSTIARYGIIWGDGSAEETSTSPTQTHVYSTPSTFTIVVTATDSIGRKRSITVVAAVTP